MAQIDNLRRIIAEDFDEQDRQLVSKLGGNLNQFMEQVYEAFQGNIDFTNTNEELASYDVTVDGSGSPTTTNKFRSDLTRIEGVQVIRATNLSNPATYPTTAPFLSFTPEGGGIFRVDNVTGLTSGDNWRLRLRIIGT